MNQHGMRTMAATAALFCALLASPRAWSNTLTTSDFPYRLSGPEPVLELPWGQGPNEVGRVDGDEAASLGPMSFTVSASGEIFVLDQVNFRVLKFGSDGVGEAEWPIPADTFQDIELFDDRVLVLLDRLVGKTILLVDTATGQIINEHSIVGPSIPHTGLTTALFVRQDGVWLEYSHAHMVRVLDAGLVPCRRDLLPGRLYEGWATSLGAAIDRKGGAQIWINDVAGQSPVVAADIFLHHDIHRIIWMEADAFGRIYAMFHLLEYEEEEITRVRFEGDVGLVFDPWLNPLAAFESPDVITEWEQLREFKVTAEGDVYHMAFAFDGVRVFRFKGVRP